MKESPRDGGTDPTLSVWLRRLDPPVADAAESLVARITAAAAPLLDARRRAPAAWWEYAAENWRLAVAAGAAVAAAAVLVLAVNGVPAPAYADESPRHALLRAATQGGTSGSLLDFAVASPEAAALDVPGRGRP